MNFCKIEGCDARVWLKGFCHKHYLWDLSVRKTQICGFNNCTRHVYEDGLCKIHYYKARPKTCKAQNCDQNADAAKGYCWRHYQQQRRCGVLQYTGELHQGVKNEYEFREDGCYMLFHDKYGTIFDEARIDANDYEKVKDLKWTLTIRDGVVNVFCRTLNLLLSRYIMDTPEDLVCDHKSGNRRDHRRANLRNCTQRANSQNRHGASCNNKLGERGISKHNKSGLYRISLKKNDKTYVKYAKQLDKAREIRDGLLVELFGEYANLT